MADIQALGRARKAFARRAWAESLRLLEEVDRDAPLEPEDLERLATAAYLMGRDADSEALRARAHQTCLGRGDLEGAARSASWLGFGLLQRGAIAPASGWFTRAERILDEARLDSVVRGYLLIPSAIQCVVQGDPASGHAAFTRAGDIARRFGDRDLVSLACTGRGRAQIRLGNIAEGVALLDEAMVAVIAGEVTPIIAGDIYCDMFLPVINSGPRPDQELMPASPRSSKAPLTDRVRQERRHPVAMTRAHDDGQSGTILGAQIVSETGARETSTARRRVVQ